MSTSIFNSYKNKVFINGENLREQKISQKEYFFADTFKTDPSYSSVSIGTKDKYFDVWITTEESHKEIVPRKKIILAPYHDKSFWRSGLYVWYDGYIWLITSADKRGANKAEGIITRCTELLKWQDEFGNIHKYPCVFEDRIWSSMDKVSNTTVVNGGFVKVKVPFDNNTEKIKANQRFLFGTENNRIGFRVQGDGVYIFNKEDIYDESSTTFVALTLSKGYVNTTTDDLKEGIADFYKQEYSLLIDQNDIEQISGFTTNLTTTIKRNGENILLPVKWKSSNINIATVDENGLLLMKCTGFCEIECRLTDNEDIYDTINVLVVEEILEPEYEIRIEPSVSQILQGDSVVYDCYLYLNDEKQEDYFNFESLKNVPDFNYSIDSIDENHFRVTNHKKYLEHELTIKCYSGENSINWNILLKGAW